LTIIAKETVLIEGSTVQEQNSGLLSNTFTAGEGGAIEVSAPLLEIRDKGTIQAGTPGKGNAGSISVDVDRLYIHQEGFITTESKASGHAGIIHITTNDLLKLHHGAITTQADKAGGGDIFLRGNNRFYLVNSVISAKASGKQQHHKGGNLTIERPNFMILDKSQLRADAYAGNGGNIRIIAEQFIKSSDSILDASSELGIDGSVQIDAPETNIGDELVVLPRHFLRARLQKQCATILREDESHFVRVNWLGVPRDELEGGVLGSHHDLVQGTPCTPVR
jgi:hypothetical protein